MSSRMPVFLFGLKSGDDGGRIKPTNSFLPKIQIQIVGFFSELLKDYADHKSKYFYCARQKI